VVVPITFALVSANLINFAGNWVLMFGHWGAPAMGLEGSGWSTTIARVYMAAVLVAAIVWHERKSGNLLFRMSWKPDVARLLRLLDLGLPAGLQILIEGGLFGVIAVLAARLDEVSLAAHGIAVNVVATTYMVPLGIGSAAAVRVGQAVGRKDRQGVATSGWTALLLGTLFMDGAGLDSPRLHGRCGRDRLRSGAVTDRGPVRALRRFSDGGHRSPARIGRYAQPHAGAPGRLLGDWPAGMLRPVFPAEVGRGGHLGRPDHGADPDRRGAGVGLEAESGVAGGGVKKKRRGFRAMTPFGEKRQG
jgi:hypothetical protein